MMNVIVSFLVGCGPKDGPVESLSEQGAAAEEPVPSWGGEGADTTTSSGVPAADSSSTIDKAVELINSGNSADVKDGLERLKAVGSAEVEVIYNMGVAYQRLGDLNNARQQYLRATSQDPSLGEAWLNLGGIYERQGDYEKALQYYRTGLKHDPEHPELVVGVIGVLRRQKKYDQAIQEAKKALATNANNVNAYNNLGLVYVDQGNLDLALFIYQKALNFIDLADQNALLHTNLGRVYLAQDKVAAARSELERAIELDPDQVAARMFLAHYFLDNRDWDKAVEMLEKGRDLEPENPDIHLNLGIAYRGQGRFEQARRSYERALEIRPNNVEPLLNLALLAGDYEQKYDEALTLLTKYKKTGGADIALADERIGEIEKAQELIRRADERKRRADERKKAREERERLAQEHEDNEKKWAQEEANEPENEGAAPEEPSDAGTDSPEDGQQNASESDAERQNDAESNEEKTDQESEGWGGQQ